MWYRTRDNSTNNNNRIVLIVNKQQEASEEQLLGYTTYNYTQSCASNMNVPH